MKNKVFIIAFIILLSLFACKNSDNQATKNISVHENSFINLEKIFDEDTLTMSFYLKWLDIVQTDILDDTYKLIDKIVANTENEPINSRKIVKDFMSKLKLDIERDIYSVIAVMQLETPDSPMVSFILEGNIKGKNQLIIKALNDLLSTPLIEKSIAGKKYYTNNEELIVSFPTENLFMVTPNIDSMEWGYSLLEPASDSESKNPRLKELNRIKTQDKTYWLLMTIPEEIKAYPEMQNGFDSNPLLKGLDCLYADGLVAGKNSASTMVMYLNDENRLEPLKSYLSGYFKMAQGMYSNYPGICKAFEDVKIKIDKKNKSVSTYMKYDFDTYWDDLLRMFDDLMPMITSQYQMER
ncbi:MAG: hypothetical protein JW737_06190 [Acidobacteria bacterium]|nr:hypothetical protein [Acidobacteriota bacterium]